MYQDFGRIMSVLIGISQNSQNYLLKKIMPLKLIFSILFHFFKVYINGIIVESETSTSTVYKYLSQDWEVQAGIGQF